MKTLEEKKLLVKMTQMLGQPVDQSLLESIKREEELNARLFKQKEPESLIEVAPPPQPAPPPPPVEPLPPKQGPYTFIPNTLANKLQDAEVAGMKKTIIELSQKVNTLAWGGGGTGVVRIHDTDDFDKNSYGEGRFLKWSQGMFRLDEINPFEITHNTTEVTSNTYVVQDSDYYVGVNVNETSTIILPAAPSSGRTVVIKDESGHAQLNPIHIDGTIDNDAGGATIKINNGAVQLLFRNGWRII